MGQGVRDKGSQGPNDADFFRFQQEQYGKARELMKKFAIEKPGRLRAELREVIAESARSQGDPDRLRALQNRALAIRAELKRLAAP